MKVRQLVDITRFRRQGGEKVFIGVPMAVPIQEARKLIDDVLPQRREWEYRNGIVYPEALPPVAPIMSEMAMNPVVPVAVDNPVTEVKKSVLDDEPLEGWTKEQLIGKANDAGLLLPVKVNLTKDQIRELIRSAGK